MVDASVFEPYRPEPIGSRFSAETVHVRDGVSVDVPACLDLVEHVLKLDPAPWERTLMASVTDPQRMLEVRRDCRPRS
jgi:hypothetical protein